MAPSVYTNAHLRNIPFSTFNPFPHAQSRTWDVNCSATPLPSTHELWKQGGAAASVAERAMSELEGVG